MACAASGPTPDLVKTREQRLHAALVDRLVRVRGTVQGVGFRPFVRRTADTLGISGWVRNDAEGVLLLAHGDSDSFERLINAISHEAPAAAVVESVEVQEGSGIEYSANGFDILESAGISDAPDAGIPADLAMCTDCRAELLDPKDRRHGYPFINCTQCGPRYSILGSLPYDRARTTMRSFTMCPACSAEYADSRSRRFHAQPNACPSCGPVLALSNTFGATVAAGANAVEQAARALRSGLIVAVKGVGGFHLMCDAANEAAVAALRKRKHRDEKPFAVMFPSLKNLRKFARVSRAAAESLESPQAPIVLVPRTAEQGISMLVSPGNPWIGALLPHSPVHAVLMVAFGMPLVATSANLSEEPLCTDDREAQERLKGIADLFLGNNRRIERPVDDSVLRISEGGTPILLRRARGYAPGPLRLPAVLRSQLLCVGAHMKSTVAVAAGSRVVLSPHIGDLGNVDTQAAFARTAEMMRDLHRTSFDAVVHDKHPDYASTRYARDSGLRCIGVQHHLAHVLSCLLENGHDTDNVLGVSWDGTGYGEDGTIWGGEFILLEHQKARRFARIRPFRLPGGEAAILDGRRVALSLAEASVGAGAREELAGRLGFNPNQEQVLAAMLERGLNAPICSSAGRLFDGTAALLGLGRRNAFEGQLPLALESAAMRGLAGGGELPFPISIPEDHSCRSEIDWRPAVAAMIGSTDQPDRSAARFHRGLCSAIAAVASEAAVHTIALTGGCFQNALLLDLTRSILESRGHRVLVHRLLPPNDGNIAAGQALAALSNITDVLAS